MLKKILLSVIWLFYFIAIYPIKTGLLPRLALIAAMIFFLVYPPVTLQVIGKVFSAIVFLFFLSSQFTVLEKSVHFVYDAVKPPILRLLMPLAYFIFHRRMLMAVRSVALVAIIITVFTSPQFTTKLAFAQTCSGTLNMGAPCVIDGVSGTCDTSGGTTCIPNGGGGGGGTGGGTGGTTGAPEMPFMLLPLFLTAAGLMIMRARRQLATIAVRA